MFAGEKFRLKLFCACWCYCSHIISCLDKVSYNAEEQTVVCFRVLL